MTRAKTGLPGPEKLMLPMLELIQDGRPYRPADLAESIAMKFSIPERVKDRVRIDGRTQLNHRLEWTRTYLKKAGLVEYLGDGTFRITDKGREAARNHIIETER